ncbi:type II toxin-antitoxin system RelE/ParE family toxin [Devosia sp.]|uniref:type II toxin-antitoxin system RelE/ParE family toxin n=1 Tax=Devosia sp. TaxID=1871048 RepID=UPI00344B01FA
MRRRRIVYRRRAREDIREIARWFALRVSRQFASAYVERIRARIRSFEFAGERGTVRDEIGPGVRAIGLMQSITIAFAINAESVIILRVVYGGQDWQTAPTTDDFED